MEEYHKRIFIFIILFKYFHGILTILSELKCKRENLWKIYHRAKTEDKKNEILTEINDIQPKIKELFNYTKYCKAISKREEVIQNDINNFDKDIKKNKKTI